MKEPTAFDDPLETPAMRELLLTNKIANIAVEISRRLGIDRVEALKRFYDSETCARLHDRASRLRLYGDLYIADEYMMEMGLMAENW